MHINIIAYMNGGRNIITLILLPIVEEADIHLSECLMPKFQQSFNKSFSKVSAKVSVKFQQSFSQSFSCRKSFETLSAKVADTCRIQMFETSA